MVSKMVTLYLHFHPWRLLWQLWRSNLFFDAKSVAKDSKNDDEIAKVTPEDTP